MKQRSLQLIRWTRRPLCARDPVFTCRADAQARLSNHPTFLQQQHELQKRYYVSLNQKLLAESKFQTRSLSSTVTEPPRALINDLPKNNQEVVVDFDGRAVRFPSFWLRDHCPCSECLHPQTKQRQLETFKLDLDTKALEAESTPDGLRVTWSDSNHIILYPWSWLRQHTPNTHLPSLYNPRGKWQHISPTSPEYPTVDYTSVMNTDIGLATFLSHIRIYGFGFVSGTPADTTSTEALANRIAFIRQTHYGGFWEVISEADPIDTAYTNLALPNHTDNTYFTDPCGLQMFHCLSHTPLSSSPSTSTTTTTTTTTEPNLGGESTLVDGFAAAQHLYDISPESYKILSSVRIVSHASGASNTTGPILNNAVHSSGNPVFTHLTPNTPPNPKNLSVIRWNNADRHSSTQWPNHQSMMTWYKAARLWDEIIHSKEFEIVVKLKPGMPVVFDNWRVLHGRKAFEGTRRLCGAYIGMDDFLAKGRAVDARLDRSGGGDDDVDAPLKS